MISTTRRDIRLNTWVTKYDSSFNNKSKDIAMAKVRKTNDNEVLKLNLKQRKRVQRRPRGRCVDETI